MEAEQNRFNEDGRPLETPESEMPRKKSRRRRSRKRHASAELPVVESSIDKKIDDDEDDEPKPNNIADELAKVFNKAKQPKAKPETDSDLLEAELKKDRRPDSERTLDITEDEDSSEYPDFEIIEGEIYVRELEDEDSPLVVAKEGVQQVEPLAVNEAPKEPEISPEPQINEPIEPEIIPHTPDFNWPSPLNETVANVPTRTMVEEPVRPQDSSVLNEPNYYPDYNQVTAMGSTGNTSPSPNTDYSEVPPAPNQPNSQPYPYRNRPYVPPLRPFGPNISSLNPDTQTFDHLEEKVTSQSQQIKDLEKVSTKNDQEAESLKDQNAELRERISRLATPSELPELPKPPEIPNPDSPDTAELPPILDAPLPIGHHLEQSAWHTIEVDSKTGKAVEEPSFNYGQEFGREQHQETIGSNDDEVAVASGQLAVATEADVRASQSSASPTKPQAEDSSLINQINPFKNTSQVNAGGNLWLWIILLIIIIADVTVIVS